MSRIRTIKPEQPRDEELALLSIYARYLFAFLPTIADREGRREDNPKTIKLDIFPWDDRADVDALLNELAPKFVLRYEAGGKRYLQIVQFLRHQRPTDREPESVIPAPEGMVKDIPKHDPGNAQACPEQSQDTPQDMPGMLGKGKGKGKGKQTSRLAATAEQQDEPWKGIADAWNTLAHTDLPRCKEVGKKRATALRERWTEHPDIAYWTQAIQAMNTQGFCLGKNQSGWRASIDFLLRPESSTKILEGAYLKAGERMTPKEKPVVKCRDCGGPTHDDPLYCKKCIAAREREGSLT